MDLVVDSSASLDLSGVELVRLGLVGQVLHDGTRLGQSHVLVHQSGHSVTRVDLEELRLHVLASRQIEVLDLYIDIEKTNGKTRKNARTREREIVELHDRRLGDC